MLSKLMFMSSKQVSKLVLQLIAFDRLYYNYNYYLQKFASELKNKERQPITDNQTENRLWQQITVRHSIKRNLAYEARNSLIVTKH